MLTLGSMPFGSKGYRIGIMVEIPMGQLSHAHCTKQNGKDGSEVRVLTTNIEDVIGLNDYEREV